MLKITLVYMSDTLLAINKFATTDACDDNDNVSWRPQQLVDHQQATSDSHASFELHYMPARSLEPSRLAQGPYCNRHGRCRPVSESRVVHDG
jgi:hypothetical protein